MLGRSTALSWYRYRATFARRWRSSVSLALLIGLVGGLSIGAAGIARRTQASFSELLAKTNASQLFVGVAVYNPAEGFDSGYYPREIRAIAGLPHVRRVGVQVGLNLLPLGPNGLPLPQANFVAEGSLNGEGFDQDRLLVTHGRLPELQRPDEFVMDAATARLWRLHLGQVVTFGVYTNRQSLAENPNVLRPTSLITARLVGVGVTEADQIVSDQADLSGNSSSTVLFTPALTNRLARCCADDTTVALGLSGGDRYQTRVATAVTRVLPARTPVSIDSGAQAQAKAERTIRPEAIALAVFAAIAGLAALVIGGQVISHRYRLEAEDRLVLQALGADRTDDVVATGAGPVVGVVAGCLLAALVGVAVSPLGPIGPIRPYLGHPVVVDWTVVGVGGGALLILLAGFAVAGAAATAPRRRARGAQVRYRASAATVAASGAGLGPSAVTGIRFALEPGRGRRAVPVRSAILGAALAVAVVTTTATFGSSLRTLVSHSRLYGFAWTATATGGGGDIPPVALTALRRDPLVVASSGYWFGQLDIDGQLTPVLGGAPGALVAPPQLSGSGLQSPGQIVLGTATLRALHTHVGGSVVVHGAGGDVRLRVVGTATLPALGNGGTPHLEMGTGAILDDQLIPPSQRNLFDQPQAGPQALFIRAAASVDVARLQVSILAALAALGVHPSGNNIVGPQRPAEIISYHNLGTVPALLGAALALGAMAALGLTLVTSVRRRQRDLAVLKVLGFTRRQVARTIAWQAGVSVGIGVVVGVPLGIGAGRWLWDLFAREIYAVPDPTVPLGLVALIILGAVVAANLVALVPGRLAAGAPPGALLQLE